jgi:hypothetical protein
MLLGLTLGLMAPARAQNVSVAFGRLHAMGDRPATYTWQLQYGHTLSPHSEATLTWLNEGHLDDHHRDGFSVQYWRVHKLESNNLQFGIGLGPYHFCDTTGEDDASGHKNQHGVKALLSLRARYPFPDRHWAGFVQFNRTLTGSSSPQTQALLIGASMRFGGAPEPSSAPTARGEGTAFPEGQDDEVSLLVGRTILNSFNSETSGTFKSFELGYRRYISRHLAFSAAYCDEGDIDSVRRDGVTAQAWLMTTSHDRKWLLGFGAGPYFNRTFADESRGSAGTSVRTTARYSMLLGRHLWGHWSGRFEWNRTITRHDRDTDTMLIGMAYRGSFFD